MYFYIVRIFILVVPFLSQFRTLFFYGEYGNALRRTWKMRCDESKMVARITSMLSLMVVLYLEKWLSIHNGHLNNVGNCLEHFSMWFQLVSVFTTQRSPVLQTFVVGFMSCTNGCFLLVYEIVSSWWSDASLFPIIVATISQIILSWSKCIHQCISCNSQIRPTTTRKRSIRPNWHSCLYAYCHFLP